MHNAMYNCCSFPVIIRPSMSWHFLFFSVPSTALWRWWALTYPPGHYSFRKFLEGLEKKHRLWKKWFVAMTCLYLKVQKLQCMGEQHYCSMNLLDCTVLRFQTFLWESCLHFNPSVPELIIRLHPSATEKWVLNMLWWSYMGWVLCILVCMLYILRFVVQKHKNKDRNEVQGSSLRIFCPYHWVLQSTKM